MPVPEFPYFYKGRWCRVSSTYRTLYGPDKHRKRFGNRYIVRFDDGTCENIPAGEFNKYVGRDVPVNPVSISLED